jgi:sugar transferase (PEP-CTERM/EpsH1 system associated)
MNDLLFLSQRIPYPPNKGDKIRSWHILSHLARHFRVHLACFVDDPADWAHVDAVRAVCAGETLFVKLQPSLARLRSLRGLLSGDPLTRFYFDSAELRDWVRARTQSAPLTTAFVFSSAMAPYLLTQKALAPARCVVDMVDIDSDKWRQYAGRTRPPWRQVYAREGRTLLHLEREMAAAFGATLFVSAHEAALFRELAPESAARVSHVNNGVDIAYFDPALPHESPFPADATPIVFTGAMDYWPNVDAVQWFAQDILPRIAAQLPIARFFIVGANPTADVRKLAALPRVVVTGRVADIRPYLAHAAACVVPLRIARGVQNKVLEAMAMAKPVIATSDATQGLAAQSGRDLLVAGDAADFAQKTLAAVAGRHAGLAANGRRFVLDTHTWPRALESLDRIIDRVAGKPDAIAPPLARHASVS